MSDAEKAILVSGYDAVYAAIPRSPTFQRLWRETAGCQDCPPEFPNISFLTLDQLHRIAAALDPQPDAAFADLACGAGGPALWIAKLTGAHLTGIDMSPVAVSEATRRAAKLGLSHLAAFTTGTFAATGLPACSQDAAMSVDALQYAPDKREAFAEAARILRPGRPLVFTSFELDANAVAGLPVLSADPVPDYRPALEQAGFTIQTYEETPNWHERLTAAYSAIMQAKETLIQEMGLIAATALTTEVSLTLERQPYRRRILAEAISPADNA